MSRVGFLAVLAATPLSLLSLPDLAQALGSYGSYKPDATTTGVPTGTALTTHSGDITVTSPGTVLSALDIHGQVKVRAANVVIKSCRVRGNSTANFNTGLIDCNHPAASGVTIQDCLLLPDHVSVWWDGIIGHDYLALRCNISNTVDGFGVYNAYNGNGAANVGIYGCYVHDLAYISPDPNHSDNHTHNDGCQIQGNSNITLRGNNFVLTCSTTAGSAGSRSVPHPNPYFPTLPANGVACTPNVGSISGLVVDKNWIDYGQTGIVMIPAGSHTVSGSFTSNVFGSHIVVYNDAGATAAHAIIADPTLSIAKFPTSTGPDTQCNNTWSTSGGKVMIYRKHP